jgi:alkaline phosphatase
MHPASNHVTLKTSIITFLLFISTTAFSQKFNVANAHAHNDYEHTKPFFEAYELGFGSVEADIWLVGNSLVVAHERKKIDPANTLKVLYIDPIKAALTKDSNRHLTLMIDLKEPYTKQLAQLREELKPLIPLCKRPGHDGQLIILLTGNVPPPEEYKNYPDYLYFDNNLSYEHNTDEWKRVGLVSLRFGAYSNWKKSGKVTDEEKALIEPLIGFVHQNHKNIRFWDAPDDEAGWKGLLDMQVDVIGTDHLSELKAFANK